MTRCRRLLSFPLAPAYLLALALLETLCVGCATTRGRDGNPVFYPAPPQRPRIQFLTSIDNATDVEGNDNLLVRFLVGDTTSERVLRKPGAVAAQAGVIYVTDTGWDGVIRIDLKERSFDRMQDRGEGKLQVPVAIAIDQAGNKFVADTGRNQVVQFNEKDEFTRAFGNPDDLKPTGVAVDETRVYVVNRQKHRVEVYDRFTKELLTSLGEFGKEDGQFNIPTSIARDPSGQLFVTDAANFRIQEYSSEREFVKSYGLLGDGPGTFARPRGIDLDRDGHLYTTDAAFENVQVWDTSNAQVLLAFGGPGIEPGTMFMPASVHVSYDLVEYFRELTDRDFELVYVILVVNNYGPHKLAVYGFIEPKDPAKYPVLPLPAQEPKE